MTRDDWPVEIDPLADYDRLGRKQPRRLNAYTILFRALPALAFKMFPQEVPPARYIRMSDRVRIHCPCGGVVEVEDLQLERCAGCDVAYVNLASRVRAGRMSRSVPPAPGAHVD